MKKLIYLLITLVIIALLVTKFVPPIVDKGANKFTIPKPYKASKKANAILHNLDFVADLHCDALLWNRDLTKKESYGHVDFKRMQEGNLALQGFTIVTKSPKGQNIFKNDENAFDMITPLSIVQAQAPKTWFNLFNRTIYQCEKLHQFAANFNNKFIVVKSKADFELLLEKRKTDKNIIGGFLGIEGGHCLEGNIKNYKKAIDAGVRMFGIAHFFDNELGGSAHGLKKAGLSKELGFEIVKLIEADNIILDLAHSSEQVIDDVLKHYNGAILTSHTGVKSVFDSPRNLSDKHLKAIAAKNGLIGIGYFPTATGDEKISSIVKTMKFTKELVGIKHVCLGSDFDGAVTTPFDVTGLDLLIDEMLNQNFTQKEIEAIMGENVKRFMLEYLK